MSIYCKNCNTQNSDYAKFCVKCGKIITDVNNQSKPEKATNQNFADIDTNDLTQRINDVPLNYRQPQNSEVSTSEIENDSPKRVYTEHYPPEHKAENNYKGQNYRKNENDYYKADKNAVKSESIVGTGAYFGYGLLFSIPIIGWIACIVMMFSQKSENIRNFSRAAMIRIIIGIFITTAIIVLIAVICGNIAEYVKDYGYEFKTADDILKVFYNKQK